MLVKKTPVGFLFLGWKEKILTTILVSSVITYQVVNMIIKESLSLRLLQVALYHVPPAVFLQQFLGLFPAVVGCSDKVCQESVEAVDGLLVEMLLSLLVPLSQAPRQVGLHLLLSLTETGGDPLLLGLLRYDSVKCQL